MAPRSPTEAPPELRNPEIVALENRVEALELALLELVERRALDWRDVTANAQWLRDEAHSVLKRAKP
jgi:hypothetical protein